MVASVLSIHLTLGVLLVSTLSSFCEAFWIIPHHALVSQRLDPIITNSTSSHVHAFVGSAAILSGQNKNKMCTTSAVKADRSNYWAPQLYYYHGNNKTFDAVPLSYVNTYYLNRYGPKLKAKAGSLKAFPKGLKMIAGNASRYDGPVSDPVKAKAVSFVCLDAHGGKETTTLPKGPCPWGLRTQIVFPSCWNGKDLDSHDHQSHVAYPLGGAPDSGDCPSTHPVKFMTLFYEFVWGTQDRQGDAKSGFVLANGDALGYSMHADFVAGWDVTTLQKAADTCTGNLFQDLKSCPAFTPTLEDEKQGTADYCSTKQSVTSESVLGTGKKSLPGCQKVMNGPFKGAVSSKCVVKRPVIVAAAGGPDDRRSASKKGRAVDRSGEASGGHLAARHASRLRKLIVRGN